jgi:hypothetical protein
MSRHGNRLTDASHLIFDMIDIPAAGQLHDRTVPTVTRFYSAVGRYRRVILTAALAVAVAYVMATFCLPDLAQRAFRTLIVLLLCIVALAIVPAMLPRPRGFEVRPEVPAFSTPPSPGDVLVTLALLVTTMAWTGLVVRKFGTTDTIAGRLPALLLVVATACSYVGTWRGEGIELRPDGLRDREWAGTLIVPWEALPVVPTFLYPKERNALPVRYGRPKLVRRQGLTTSRRRLLTDNIDQKLAAQVIRYYTTHPEHRPAIGTRAEYDRLLTEISEPPSAPDQDL